MPKQQPTNRDLLESINKRFNMVFAELKKSDSRFDLVFRQLHSIKQGQKDAEETQKADGEVLDEIRDTVDSIAKAVDADAMTIVNHETRISRIEKALK